MQNFSGVIFTGFGHFSFYHTAVLNENMTKFTCLLNLRIVEIQIVESKVYSFIFFNMAFVIRRLGEKSRETTKAGGTSLL